MVSSHALLALFFRQGCIMSDEKPTTPAPAADLEAAAAALDRLAQRLAPPTVGAQIRRLLPKIEAAMAAGASHEQIVQTLRETGIDVSMNTFRSALYRARRKARKEEREKEGKDSRKKESAGGGAPGGPASDPPAREDCAALSPGREERARDPLAVPERPRSFEWDPTARPNITFINRDDEESSS
jgi:hypothetical protein